MRPAAHGSYNYVLDTEKYPTIIWSLIIITIGVINTSRLPNLRLY